MYIPYHCMANLQCGQITNRYYALTPRPPRRLQNDLQDDSNMRKHAATRTCTVLQMQPGSCTTTQDTGHCKQKSAAPYKITLSVPMTRLCRNHPGAPAMISSGCDLQAWPLDLRGMWSLGGPRGDLDLARPRRWTLDAGLCRMSPEGRLEGCWPRPPASGGR